MGVDWRVVRAFLSVYTLQVGSLSIVLLIALTGLGLGTVESFSDRATTQSDATAYGPAPVGVFKNRGGPVFLSYVQSTNPPNNSPVPVYWL